MSSRKMVAIALGCVAVYVLAGWLGGGEGVAVLSGTVPAGMAVGLLYALSYFAAVVASPILLFAAAALRLREFRLRPVR